MHVGTFWDVELPVEGEAILRRFEEAWQGPAPPDLESFLPIRGEYPTSLLLHLISVDLDFRLRNGEPAKVEHYLERHPALASEPEALLNLIALEYSLRQCWGAGGTPEEYLLRFPPLAEPLRVRLSIVEDEPGREVTEPPGVWPVIPGYVIQRELGRGGMGVVYQAKQDALGRVVALKTILPTCVALRQEINRFHRETEAIARLDHPQIVPIYEVGEYDGRPFFSMKYYPGGSLSQRVDGPSVDPHAHARLVEVIARAVHHAHQRGVLHRDIKPSNILLDESGQPHVADFGLAKRFDRQASATAGSALVGTPGYISPEQAQGSRAVTTVSDVYGLGAVLYELLTGEPPFRAGTALATLFQVVESTPRRPSRMNPVVPPDLETICLKCLEKEPSRRYPSAWDLAEDLQRWRNGDSIRARPASTGERAWRWTRRHPVVATLSLVTGLALLLVIVTLAMSNARISAQEMETARALAQERRALGREQRLLYVERIAAASQLWSSNHLQLAEPLLDECPPRFRHHWEWKFLNAFRRPYLNSIAHEEMVTALAYAPRQRYLASATSSGQVKLWDSESGHPLPCAMHHGNFVTGLTFSPDGRQLATADRGGVKVWDVATGTLMFSLAGSFWAEFSPDGRHLASALGRDVKIWDAQTGQELHTFLTEIRSVRHGSFSPDSSQLAVGGAIDGRDEHSGPQGAVELWNVPDGRRIGESHEYALPIHSVVYAADGGSLVLGQGNSVLLTEVSTGLVRRQTDALMFSRARLQVSPNRRYLAYALSDCTVRVLDLQTWQDVSVLRGHRVEVDALTFSPDGRRLASGGKDRTVKVWDLTRESEVRVLAPVKPATGGVAFHSRGTQLALASDWTGLPADQDAAVRVLDPSTGREVLRVRGCNDVAFGPNGDWLATGTPEGLVTLWDTATGREIRTIGDAAHASYRLIVSQDGRRLFSGSRDGTIQVWDPSDGSLIATWRGDSGRIEAMALSPDGSRLATTGPESGVRLWDTGTGIRVRAMEDPSSFSTVAISPDGRLVAAAGIDRVIRLWELSTGRPAGALHGHSDKVNKVAFSPDGQRLVSASSDGSARLWDLEFGRELLALPGVTTVVSGIAFSPDGLRIAATDFHIKIWDVTSSQDGVAIGDNDENSLNE